MAIASKNVSYNKTGQTIQMTFQLRYEDLEVLEYPKSCASCPVGFASNGDCGRNVPFEKDDYKMRPKSCRLKKVRISELIKGGNVI